MAWTIKAKIEGVEELMEKLKRFPGAIQRRILRPALRQEASRILKQAKANVPVETKLLKRSLGSKLKTYKNGGVVAIIGPRRGFREVINGRPRNPSKYAHLVEFGAKPHIIPARTSLKTRRFIQSIRHPGFRGKKPLTRAYNTALIGAAGRMSSRMAQEVKKLAAQRKLKF